MRWLRRIRNRPDPPPPPAPTPSWWQGWDGRVTPPPLPAPGPVAVIRVLNVVDSYQPPYDPAEDHRTIAANLAAATEGTVGLKWEVAYRDMGDITWKPDTTLQNWFWFADAWTEKVAAEYKDAKADCLAIFVHPFRRPGLGASGFDLSTHQGKVVQGHVLTLMLDPDSVWRGKYFPPAVEHELKHSMDDIARQRLGIDLSAMFKANWDWEIIHSPRIRDVWPMLYANGLLARMFREAGAL